MKTSMLSTFLIFAELKIDCELSQENAAGRWQVSRAAMKPDGRDHLPASAAIHDPATADWLPDIGSPAGSLISAGLKGASGLR